MKRYLVAIFYIESEGQGNEITLAIEGWRKHFKDNHEILVVGDKPPVDGVKWMYVDRLPERKDQYRPALDICNKLMYACQYCHEHMYNGFIWSSDDFFAVNDFTIEDVLAPKYYQEEMPSKGLKDPNHFWRTQVKTRMLCEREGYDIINWVTHLPMWFDAEKLFWLIYNYKLTDDGYIVENIYYNKYRPEGNPVKLSRKDRWQFMSYYSPLDWESLEFALANQIWVCCSVNGWCKELEDALKRHYDL